MTTRVRAPDAVDARSRRPKDGRRGKFAAVKNFCGKSACGRVHGRRKAQNARISATDSRRGSRRRRRVGCRDPLRQAPVHVDFG